MTHPHITSDRTRQNACAGQSAQRRSGGCRRAWVLACSLLVGACIARGQVETKYRIDPAKSSVQFSLTGIHTVDGSFSVSSGNITFNRTTGAMSGSVDVAAASGTSGERLRDKRMDKEELLVNKFPAITFSPARFTGTLAPAGTSTLQVAGTLTLLGHPHPVTVPMTVSIQGNDCTASGTFVIPYVAWALKDPSTFILRMDKHVTVRLNFSGTLSR